MTTLHSSRCHVKQSSMSLSQAILIYSGVGAGGFATVHDVLPSDDPSARPQLMAGTPVTRKALVALMGDLSATESFGFLPENVLAVGDNYLVWWSKPQTRNVWFNADEPLGARCGKTPQPGLIFAVLGNAWSVHAVKGETRPSPDTPLFQAPYFNVWESGRICTGNVTLPSMSSVDRISTYEDAFFRSYFTHPNIRGKGRLTKFRGGPFALWLSLLNRPRKVFPESSLVRINRTAGALVNSITNAQELLK